MTKQHFIAAAAQVKDIVSGEWSFDVPGWADAHLGHFNQYDDDGKDSYVRAVQTAEAYILLFRQFNPRFDQHTFLVACGLAEPTPKRTRKG